MKYTEEYLKQVIQTSKNKKECLKKLEINNNSYNTLDRYIKKYNLNISHFKHERDIKSLLVYNSNYSIANIKRRLFKEGLKHEICEKCGQDNIWNGEKFSLILDHINGINNDNRLENLRILCPNCNATLKTHCDGNRKEKKLLLKKKIY
jgi:hypothetical protein